ncbi:MAG: 4-hydroxy-tetrahydrodipicolinate reductase [Chromatiales bacterium]|nr:4-hydroxy-tetrahydrodipicolinate reductase [Chromatiales bacterium]
MEQQPIRIAINGVAGLMGRTIAREMANHAGMTVTHAYDNPTSPAIKKPLCEISKTDIQTIIEPSDTMAAGDFDVLIDFSVTSSVIDAAQSCVDTKRPIVIGVTGFDFEQKEKLQTFAKNIPMLMSPNMSMGANLCYKLLEYVARTAWAKAAQVDIIETHHKEKKDKPSGTALRMRDIIAKHSGAHSDDIPIESYREGLITGEHRVFFSLNRERVEIRHEAMDRSVFANGAIQAARWLVETRQKAGRVYTMQDVIKFPV